MLTQMNGFRILGIRESIVYLKHKLKFNKLKAMFNKGVRFMFRDVVFGD